jgi:hypothetical protein
MFNNKQLWFIDKYGFPVECVIGKPIICFLRHLIHTRSIKFSKDFR